MPLRSNCIATVIKKHINKIQMATNHYRSVIEKERRPRSKPKDSTVAKTTEAMETAPPKRTVTPVKAKK